jgi:hypothetical protein
MRRATYCCVRASHCCSATVVALHFTADDAPVLLEDQDRARWNRPMIEEALAMLEQGGAPRPAEAIPDRGRDRGAPCPRRPARGHQLGRDRRTHTVHERQAPSPVVTLNRAVAVWKHPGPEPALAMVEPLAEALSGYFYFHGVHGVLLDRLGRRADAPMRARRSAAPSRSPTRQPRPATSASIRSVQADGEGHRGPPPFLRPDRAPRRSLVDPRGHRNHQRGRADEVTRIVARVLAAPVAERPAPGAAPSPIPSARRCRSPHRARPLQLPRAASDVR